MDLQQISQNNTFFQYFNPLSKIKTQQFLKTKLTTYDKVFYYYTVNMPMPIYAHKAFMLLEMQLNASLVRMKLVPYIFLVSDLCFYRLININNKIVNSPFHVLSLYDLVSIPVPLYNYMYYRQYRIQKYPQQLAQFFKQY
jgi:ribosomal protein S4